MRLTRALVERKKQKRSGAASAGSEAGTGTETATSRMTLHNPNPHRQVPFFLNIAPEVRIQIYALLEDIPEHDGDQDRPKAKHYDGFSKTRKSLLLTCRQINEEFTPYFYRSTTFCLRYMSHTPREFYSLLSTMGPVKVKNIRHVEYRNRQFRPTDFAVLEDMPLRLADAGLHLATFNVVHGDYVNTSILRAPLALAILLFDLDRPMPFPDMNWTTFDYGAWGRVVRHSYGIQFKFFEHEVTTYFMRQASVRREHGPSGFRVLFRQDRRAVDIMANNPPVAPPPVERRVEEIDDGPTLAGILCPLVPPRPTPEGEDRKQPPRRRIRLD